VSTIKDIAKRARVSTATVSNVINDSRFVSADLRERVMVAIAELDYRPNTLAKSLRQKKSSTIGLIVPDNSNPFFAEVAKGVEDAGYEAGISVILCNSDGSFDRECRYLRLLADKQVDGIILIATTPRTDHLSSVIDRGLPAVVFYRRPPGARADSLTVDNLGGGYCATRHLIELGHRRIACVAPASLNSPSAMRVSGFRKAIEEAGLEIDEALIFRGDNRFAGGREGARRILETGRPFTALFAGNDVMAVGAMREFQGVGLHVPADISVVGFDGISLGNYVIPSLTTVVQPRFEAGQKAFELLNQRIGDGYDGSSREVELATSLEVRESTAPPRFALGSEATI
jgi:LacI family transcriptional regulator